MRKIIVPFSLLETNFLTWFMLHKHVTNKVYPVPLTAFHQWNKGVCGEEEIL